MGVVWEWCGSTKVNVGRLAKKQGLPGRSGLLRQVRSVVKDTDRGLRRAEWREEGKGKGGTRCSQVHAVVKDAERGFSWLPLASTPSAT